jgi:Na+/proline symporter
MSLSILDWTIVAVSLSLSFLPAMLLARRAGSSTVEFFTSGRSAPWWLVGTSMVATTFSTDTPNLVTNLVRDGGVSANWVWWAFLLTGMMTVLFYARLWRRLGVLTDLEFYELRYSGRAATWVRGFRAIYLGAFFNVVIMAVVTLAAAKIANALLGWPIERTLVVCGVINVAFAATSGLWGVLVTDLIQFGVVMAGSILAAVYALRHPAVGGLDGLIENLRPETVAMLPPLGDWNTVVPILLVPLAVQWWATWYPGSEPGGGSYIAQRILAARSERDALAGTLLFSVAHYALRPWPWLIVALSSMLVFPEVADIGRALPHIDPRLLGDDMAYSAMLTFLPSGVLGLMVAGLLAAYVSTMSTHLNWGTSYLVHDFYRRFLRRSASERHYVMVGRLVTVLLMLCAAAGTLVLESARAGFDLMLSIGAGTGLLYLLRWFWWRINAWSEIAAMVSSFVMAALVVLAARRGFVWPSHLTLVATVAVTTVAWLATAVWSAPTDHAVLERFYRLARPAGPGWRHVRESCGGLPAQDNLTLAFGGWILGCVCVYSALFGTGHLLLGSMGAAGASAALCVIAGTGLWRLLARTWTA